MCDLCWEKWHRSRFFSMYFGFPRHVYQKGKGAKPKKLSKKKALYKIDNDWIQKYFHLACKKSNTAKSLRSPAFPVSFRQDSDLLPF